MANLFLIFVCLLFGVGLKRFNIVPKNAHVPINQVVLYFSLPALTLYYIPQIELSWQVIYPILVAWINLGLAFFIFAFIGRKLGWSKALIGAMIMMTGFGNTSFIGIPVINALYGDKGLETVILVDQSGFVALSTLGVAIAMAYSKKQKKPSHLLLQVVKFPTFIAFALALFLNLTHFPIPDFIHQTLEMISTTVVPLSLISVGLQWGINLRSQHWNFLYYGLIFKLLIVPFIIFTLYFLIFQQSGETIKISILESAMAPMITAGIIASSYGLKPKFCSMMLGIGIPLSFVTLTIWYFLLEYIVH